MEEQEVISIFKKTGAILEGHFLLSSGLHSPGYAQCAKVLQYPAYAEKLCKLLADKCKKAMSHCEEPKATKPASPAGRQSQRSPRPCGPRNDNRITAVMAPALGGVIVSYEVARALGVKSIFSERKDGKMELRRGFSVSKGDNVLVVEDVITTGLSTKEVISLIRSLGAEIAAVGCLIDRSGGKADLGVKTESLIRISAPTYEPAVCPLCKEGSKPVKPGSRK